MWETSSNILSNLYNSILSICVCFKLHNATISNADTVPSDWNSRRDKDGERSSIFFIKIDEEIKRSKSNNSFDNINDTIINNNNEDYDVEVLDKVNRAFSIKAHETNNRNNCVTVSDSITNGNSEVSYEADCVEILDDVSNFFLNIDLKNLNDLCMFANNLWVWKKQNTKYKILTNTVNANVSLFVTLI